MEESLIEKLDYLREENSGAFFSQDELRQIFSNFLKQYSLSYEMLEALTDIDQRIICAWQSGDISLTPEGIQVLLKACQEMALAEKLRQ